MENQEQNSAMPVDGFAERIRLRFSTIAEVVNMFEKTTGKRLDAFRYNDEPQSPEFFLSFTRPVGGQSLGTNSGS